MRQAMSRSHIPGWHGLDKRERRDTRLDGDFVRRVRLALGLTQQQFADVFRVTRLTVIRWECGRQRLQRTHAVHLQALLAGVKRYGGILHRKFTAALFALIL